MTCNCPPKNDCAECVEPPSTCVNRLDGVTMEKCKHCSPEAIGTWHHKGKCLRCKRYADGMTDEDDNRFSQAWWQL